MLLEPGFNLTLRPMAYPDLYEMYRNAIRNTWTVEEVDFSSDLVDLRTRMNPAEQHLINRLVAFFATGDSIVSNNLVLNLYEHINAPEARMYLSRQLYEEALHVQFYLTLLDTYIPEPALRAEAFTAIENIPSIQHKAQFCMKWMASVQDLGPLTTPEKRRRFLLNLLCFASCIEGLFFFASFAYIYYLRSRGMLDGLASGTNWVFRDESMHMQFAFRVFDIAVEEEPELFDDNMKEQFSRMLDEAIECELLFAADILSSGLPGLTLPDVKTYLRFIANQRLQRVGIDPVIKAKNPFPFMELQDVQELTNFFERRVAAYQSAVEGDVALHQAF